MVEVLLGFPTVVFSVLLAVSVLYWLYVIFSGTGLHADGGHGDLDGGHGDLDAHHGDVDGGHDVDHGDAGDGDAGDGDADHGDGGHGDGHGGRAFDIFALLRPRKVPATIVLTLFSAFGWLSSGLAMSSFAPAVSLPRWLFGVLVLLGASLLALFVTSLATRPLSRIFVTTAARAHRDLVGQTCIVSTGRVDATFGQATLEDGGAGFILQVRCDREGALKRGDQAVIISWDAEKHAFNVEPADELVKSRPEAGGGEAEEPAEAAERKGRA